MLDSLLDSHAQVQRRKGWDVLPQRKGKVREAIGNKAIAGGDWEWEVLLAFKWLSCSSTGWEAPCEEDPPPSWGAGESEGLPAEVGQALFPLPSWGDWQWAARAPPTGPPQFNWREVSGHSFTLPLFDQGLALKTSLMKSQVSPDIVAYCPSTPGGTLAGCHVPCRRESTHTENLWQPLWSTKAGEDTSRAFPTWSPCLCTWGWQRHSRNWRNYTGCAERHMEVKTVSNSKETGTECLINNTARRWKIQRLQSA